jgi:hypothetical protein
MCNEPSYKYSLANICDKNSDHKTWLSYKLQNLVLYVETLQDRYEISLQKDQEDDFFLDPSYRIAKLKEPIKYDNEFIKSVRVPLEPHYLENINKDLDWAGNSFSSTI